MHTNTETTPNARISGVAGNKGSIRGIVKYYWGTVDGAIVKVGERSATADSSGEYEISGLEPAIYDVQVSARFPGSSLLDVTQKVKIAAGEAKSLDIYLDFKRTVVEGHVYGSEGKPIPDATLSGILSGSGSETTKTDEKGYFKFENASPGNQFMRVNAAGYMGETRGFAAKEGVPTALEFHLTAATHKVYGAITDASGRPIRAQISLSKSGIITERTTSDSKTGYYEFALLPGVYDINASAPECQSKGWRGLVSADAKIDFSLDPAREPDALHDGSCPGEHERA